MIKVFNIFKFLLAAVLFGVSALIVGYYSMVVILHNPSQFTEEKIVALFMAITLFIFFSVLFLPLVTLLPERKIRIRITRVFVGIVLLVFLAYQLIDAPRPRDAHTINDLQSADPGSEQQSFVANALIWEKVGTFAFNELFKEEYFFCSIDKREAEVLEAWRQLKSYRILIDQLASHDRLPLPYALDDKPLPNYMALENYAYVYRAYALLQAGQGNLENAVRELSTLQRVIRNGLEGSIGFIQKKTWFAMLQINVKTAYQVARNHDLTEDQLKELQSAFAPLDSAVLDLNKAYLEEYLLKKSYLDLPFEQKIRKGLFLSSGAYPLENKPLWLQELAYRLTFQRNRTALMLGDEWQSTVGLNPFLTEWQFLLLGKYFEDVLDLHPPPRNLSGWLLFGPAFDSISKEQSVHPKVLADLFAQYLNSSREIHAGNLVSPGDDKVAGTKDDVTLGLLCLPN